MDEQQKSLSLIHRTIITLATIIFLVAVSPDQAAIYSDALEELSQLRKVNYLDYAVFAINNANKKRDQIHDIVRDQIKYAGGTISKDFLFTEAVFTWWPNKTDKLSDYLEFFEKENTLSFLTFAMQQSSGDIYRKLTNKLKNIPGRSVDLSNFEVNWVQVIPTKEDNLQVIPIKADNKIILRAASPTESDDIPRDELAVHLLNKGQLVPAEKVKFNYGFKRITKDGTERFLSGIEDDSTNRFTTASMKSDMRDFYALEWLKTTKLRDMLLTRERGQEILFKSMRKLWPQLEDKTPQEAASFLQSTALSKKSLISFLGADVDPSIVILSGPIVLLSLLVFFYAHLINFKITLEKNPSYTEFFWAPLFPGYLSKVLSYFSILAVPIGAVIAMWARYGSIFSWIEQLYYIVNMILFFLIGYFIVLAISKCNSLVQLNSR